MLKNMVAIAAIFFAGTGSALALNNSAFVSQVVPTTMVVGTTYTVSVTLQNTGDTTWTSAAYYRLAPQNPHENPAWGVGRAHLTGSVAPAANVTITFNVVAPNTAGTYNFQWRMLQENGSGWFGALTTNVAITVTGVNQAQYVYDEIGRLVEVVAPNGSSRRYAYDPAGNITSISVNSATTVSIAEFTPNVGLAGTPVTIYGSGYITTPASNTVKFNGIIATVTAATATSLTTTVPVGAATGPIAVTNANGTGASLSSFTVGAITTAAPTITSVSPTIGTAGTPVTITGTNFQTAAASNQVRFGTWAAAVASATATTIGTTVPAAEASGPISVTTPYGTAVSTGDFYAVPSGTLDTQVEVKTRMTVNNATPTAVITTLAGKKALLIFNGTQGAWVSLALTGGNFAGAITATAYRLDGTVLSTKAMANSDRLDMRLPASGTYTILLAPGATDKGTINAHLRSAVVANLTVGTASALTIPSGRIGAYTFTSGGNVLRGLEITGVTLTGTSTVTLLLPEGTPRTSTTTTTTGSSIVPLTLVPHGTYTVLVQPTGIVADGNVTLKVAEAQDLAIGTVSKGAVTYHANGSYSFPITWSVTNVGGWPAVGYVDRCYLSAGTTSLDASDPTIGGQARSTPLAAGVGYTVTTTCTTPTTTPSGNYRIYVKTDGDSTVSPAFYVQANGSVLEKDETNNTGWVDIVLPGKPDLRASNLSFGAITLSYNGSYSFPVTFDVKNWGVSPAPAGYTDYCYLSTNNPALDGTDARIGGVQRTTPVAAGATYAVTTTCTTPAPTTPGNFWLFVKTDGGSTVSPPFYTSSSAIVESDETNNEVFVPITLLGLPDLRVSNLSYGAITLSYNGSYSFPVTFNVKNWGLSPAPAGYTDYCYLSTNQTLDDLDPRLGGVGRATPVAPGETYAVTTTCTTPAPTTPGNYYLAVKTDGGSTASPPFYTSSSSIVESDETNNAMFLAINLLGLPDLVPSEVAIGTITVGASGAYVIPVTFKVTNSGLSPAAAGYNDYCYLSTNSTLDEFVDPTLSGQTRATALAAGANYIVSLSCITPPTTPSGATYLFLKTDGGSTSSPPFYTSASSILEANDGNNAISVIVNLPTKPDLEISALSAGTVTKIGTGMYSIPVTFTVTNRGQTAPLLYWGDSCYLSANGALDAATPIMDGGLSQPAGLAPNASYTVSLTCTSRVPTSPGPLTRVYVKTDAYHSGGYYAPGGNVAEQNEGNNAASVAVTLPP